ncbi:MAG: hypothetical protein NZ765_00575 [Anaerolineae bacterium]|nr:hypothetical protein [Anaerolineae bacterium]MDW8070189.1 hypothetical protein [Anaerolineae bacterium]
MSSAHRWLLVLLAGILLLALPFAVRSALTEWRTSPYRPAITGQIELAATPEPTPTAVPAPREPSAPVTHLRRGVVVVDLAHFNMVSPSQFQALSAQLAARGVALRFWTNPTPMASVDKTNLAGLPDQSDQLANQLRDASALVVISPLFLWKDTEIAVVERFVADGGRLLLISDPDMLEVPDRFLRDLNRLAERFGVVFHDDYLYDLIHNDRNFTHVYQSRFEDRAAKLQGKTIVFYGVRSLGGPIISQVRTSDTVQSSLRTGLSGFTTVAIAGLTVNRSSGRVLAMGDFDVLTEPYVSRYDNRLMLEFVADFLAAAQREQELADFPAYLGARVGLTFGGELPLDAPFLAQVSQLQQLLETGGRTLELVNPRHVLLTTTVTFHALTGTPQPSAAPDPPPLNDLIYVASYEAAERETILLRDIGIRLTEITPTPTATPTPSDIPTLGVTPSPAGLGMSSPALTTTPKEEEEEHASHVTAEVTPTPSATPEEEATLTPTSTPAATRVLETSFSPPLLLDETVLILRRQIPGDTQITAVLGSDLAALESGLDRLVTRNFADCVTRPDVLICPFQLEESSAVHERPPTGTPTSEAATGQPTETPTVQETPGVPLGSKGEVLVVDDNRTATADDPREADLYVRILEEMGRAPVLWHTKSDGDPNVQDLVGYRWVIWSRGVYRGEPAQTKTLAALALYLERGGHLTISGRTPVLGGSNRPASVIADIVLTDEVPPLVVGLSSSTITLAPDLPPAVPLGDQWGGDAKVAMRRGPNSADADAPVLVALKSDDASEEARRVIILGMALNWLSDADSTQLVRNMATWMLER